MAFECTIENSGLFIRWGFKESFIQLPDPGDKHFSALFKALSSFGVQLNSMSYEDSGETLADARLVISLLNNHANLRLAHAGFELTIQSLDQGDENKAAEIIQSLSSVYKEMGAELESGHVQITWQAYVSLNVGTPDDILSLNIANPQNDKRLRPDAFAYRIKLSDESDFPQVRAVVAHSIASNFPNAVYSELTLEYNPPGDIFTFGERAINDFNIALESIGLKIKDL